METRRNRALRSIIYVLDAVIIVLSMIGAFLLHNALRDVLPILKGIPDFDEYALIAILTLPLWLILVPVFGLNQVFERLWTQSQILVQLLKHHLTGLVFLVVVLFLTQITVNRSLVALFLMCTFVLMYLERAILSFRLRYAWRQGHGRSRIILVGAPSDCMADFVNQAMSVPLSPSIVGRISAIGADERHSDEVSGIPEFLGDVSSLEQVLHDKPVDQVLFFPPLNDPEKAQEALSICEILGIPASFAIELARPGLAIPKVVSQFDYPFITFDVVPQQTGLRAIKHGFDSVASALGLIVLIPLFLVVSIAILFTMGKPIFFIQERAGLYGRRFRMLKFRTMVTGAEGQRDDLEDDNEMDGPVFKVTNDPRITRFGRFLRRSSIDELPQLINVLGGTMSLVGPRPLPVDEQQEIYGWYRRRLSMKPGITGLWQVSGRSEVGFEDWMRLDLQYVDNWSPGLDAIILLKTIRAVLFKDGAK